MTLVEFLLARIAEDEAWAIGATETPGATHWHWVNSDTDEPVRVEPLLDEMIDYPDDGDSLRVDLRTVEELKPGLRPERPLPDFVLQGAQEIRTAVAGHIARWNPARVLAECEAKRRIVEHADTVSSMDRQIESEWGTRSSVPWDEDEGIRLLRLLALPYADHPDYDPKWAEA
jgi:hypothetical protein